MWVLDPTDGARMTQRSVAYVPGLYKIFDEILVNAADHSQRDPAMDTLRVDIDAENNTLSVWNNGRGIPVAVHKEHGVFIPELIFGHLLTGSNYDDSEKKTTGGRNGYGAKLANIFSTRFVVETADSERGKTYRQVFSRNMSAKEAPVIKGPCTEDWTRISFSPDLPRFGMTSLDDDIVALFTRRVYDVAGSLRAGMKVYLNGKRVPVRSFREYVEMYLPDPRAPRVHERVNDRWEVVATVSDGSFQQVSFVNSIATSKGGNHVACVVDQVASELAAVVQKKLKGEVKPNQVKNYLFVFVNCLIDNPAFDSQTKENLTTRQQSFGSSCTLSDKFHKECMCFRGRVAVCACVRVRGSDCVRWARAC